MTREDWMNYLLAEDLEINKFIKFTQSKNPGEKEFLQCSQEIVQCVWPFVQSKADLKDLNIFARLLEPDEVCTFNIDWKNEDGDSMRNRAYRVRFSNLMGPYRGPLRFHPSVNMSTIKFLALNQTITNALLGFDRGGSAGGSDFDPRHRSEGELARFFSAFMKEFCNESDGSVHVMEAPLLDIGFGPRELAVFFKEYKKIQSVPDSVLPWGSSCLYEEAAGYGLVYFLQELLETERQTLQGKRIAISGCGNVALFAAQKCLQCGAKITMLSDSSGFILDEDGIDRDKLDTVLQIKQTRGASIAKYVETYTTAKFFAADVARGIRDSTTQSFACKGVWSEPASIALPCSTQNEIDAVDATALVNNGVKVVAEGAHMACTPEAIEIFKKAGVVYVPSRVSATGGLAVSMFESIQSKQRRRWRLDEVDRQLAAIMRSIHSNCVKIAEQHRFQVRNFALSSVLGAFHALGKAMHTAGTTSSAVMASSSSSSNCTENKTAGNVVEDPADDAKNFGTCSRTPSFSAAEDSVS